MKTLLTRMLTITVVCFSFFAVYAFAQQGTDSSKGQMSVEVKDATGATVPGAKVTAAGPMGDLNATTNDRGEVNFFSLVPGVYKLRVAKDGFSTAEVQQIGVDATKVTSVPVTLQPGQVSQTVQVEATAALVDTTSTTIQTNLDSSQYQNCR